MSRLLVIEDEAPLRETILSIVHYAGFEAIGARDGAAGVELAQTYQPDLVISDIHMPQMDGYDVLQALRSDPETAALPVIFLTAKTAYEDMRAGMELGADDYLTKPFTNDELLAAIESRLQHRETVMQLASQQLDALKRQLTRIVAHELRTPLSNIDMTTQIARRQFGDTPIMHEFVQAIDASCLRMKRVVDQTVLIGQLEAGVLEADTLEETGLLWPLEDTLHKAIHMARRMAYKQADLPIIQTGMAGETPILCYPAALQHALAELIANALVYSPENGDVLVFQGHDQDTLQVQIIDQGPGIPGDRERQVLEGFRQLNRDQHEQQGMGLGLALARAIIDAHQGQLSIHSTAGQGTTLTVALPLALQPMNASRKELSV